MTTLHLVALPHTETTRAFESCAFTAKCRRFADMMTSVGRDVVLYGGEANEGACVEHVPCITRDEQRALFPERIPAFEPTHPGFALFNQRATKEIEARAESGDYLCLIGGTAQEPIARALPQLVAVEFGVGYGGVFSDFRVFESYAWMHTVYGAHYGTHQADGRFYDAVIPNSYDIEEFPPGTGEGGYLLYVGRLIERKGMEIVRLVADRTGLPLVVAGEGDERLIPPGARYLGVIGPAERAKVMGDAVALLAPTLYIEPFGGVAVEAQLCGTPVITTDWGAFTETVEYGVTGFRCRLLSDFCRAVRMAANLDRFEIRERAAALYSTDVIRWEYNSYFDRLDTLRDGGWYD